LQLVLFDFHFILFQFIDYYFSGHDSTITFIDVTAGAPGNVQLLRLNNLPFTRVFFVTENQLVAGGHDCSPILFSNLDGTWFVRFVSVLVLKFTFIEFSHYNY
jgi:hypothetical protein